MTADETLFSTPEMANAFSADAHVSAILEFEAALARAEAAAGVIPLEAATAVSAACRVELYDVPALTRAIPAAGAITIPLVKALTAQVAPEGRGYVHWGATSQDAIDTALMLQARSGLALLIDRLLAVADACATLSERHRHTSMPGRTLLQQALPITFGLKAARWLALVTRQVWELRRLQRNGLALQFGGAVGTLASLGDAGIRVTELLADELELSVPELPWHTERDRLSAIAAGVGIVAASMAKIASDVALLTQTEIGEVSEAVEEGKGGSSTLPHKRNPVDVTFARASAQLALGSVSLLLTGMAHEHERAAGAWQAEWTALPQLFRTTDFAVERVRSAVVGLNVYSERMHANLELTDGLLMAESLSMALAARIGRQDAYRIVQLACERAREQQTSLLTTALAEEAITTRLTADEISGALDPASYLGSTDAFIDRALAGYRELRAPVEMAW